MNAFKFALLFGATGAHWTVQNGGTSAGLRGLTAVSQQVGWTSGTHGTILRTLDGGAHWEPRKVAGAEALDFRDVEAFDAQHAIVMSSGNGAASRIYVTANGGANWTLTLSNSDAAGFFDAVKFWDRRHGVLLGDPVAGRFTIFLTSDGGQHWVRNAGPEARTGEGAFAASGTCLRTFGTKEVWFGSGGIGVARVFHSGDQGQNWTAADTPLAGSTVSSGIFSLLFMSDMNGIAAGGDYQKPEQTTRTLAVTHDGGKSWNVPPSGPAFRSGLSYVKKKHMVLAVGSGGSSLSMDGGNTWTALSQDSLNAADDDWAVGPKGLIVRLTSRP